MEITTTDGHQGTGEARGPSAGGSLGNGILSFNSWEQMMSGTNNWRMAIIGQNIFILFVIKEKLVARFVGPKPDQDFAHAAGQMDWSVV